MQRNTLPASVAAALGSEASPSWHIYNRSFIHTFVIIKRLQIETGEWVCGVGVGVRRGLRGASVPRWSA